MVLNLNGFYNSLLKLIDDLIVHGAVIREIHTLFDVVDSVDDENLSKIMKDIMN